MYYIDKRSFNHQQRFVFKSIAIKMICLNIIEFLPLNFAKLCELNNANVKFN